MMYYSTEHQIKTKLSGGRPHFKFRDNIVAVNTYPYRLNYDENPYTLSESLFGTDSYWWIIADMNKPRDPFEYEIGDTIILAEAVVENSYTKVEIL